MALRSTTQSCSVTTNWEWVQGSGSGGSKPVTASGVTINTNQDWGWDGVEWSPASSVRLNSGQDTYLYSDGEGYSGSIPIQSWSGSTNPPSGSGSFGEIKTGYGSGTATYSGTVNKTASYYWGAVSTTHNHSDSVYYDDGSYAGNLPYLASSCTGSAPTPTSTGSYVGETATTTGTGTASYSGDIPPKSGGSDPDPPPTGTRPSNWTWTTLTPTAITYTSGKAKVNLVAASEWISFCQKINGFRSYKGLGAITFATPYATGDFTEMMYDEARLAIAAMTTVNNPSGHHSKLVALKDALNSIT